MPEEKDYEPRFTLTGGHVHDEKTWLLEMKLLDGKKITVIVPESQ